MGNGSSSFREDNSSSKIGIQPQVNTKDDTSRPPEQISTNNFEKKTSGRGLFKRGKSGRKGNQIKPAPENNESTSKLQYQSSVPPPATPSKVNGDHSNGGAVNTIPEDGLPAKCSPKINSKIKIGQDPSTPASPSKSASSPEKSEKSPLNESRTGGEEVKNVRTRRGQIYEKGINPQKGMRQNLQKGASSRGMNREEFKTMVVSALRQFFFMGEEVFERMDLVLDSMRDEEIAAGEYLMRQGEEGNKMYVIQSGQLEITIDGNLIRMLSAGDAVGELALLFNTPRSASVKAAESCVVWSLARETFREVQALASSAQLVQRVAWLLDVPCLKQLDKLDLCKLASSLKAVPLRDGEVVINEGAATDRIILVEAGVVRATSSSISSAEALLEATKVVLPSEETAQNVLIGENKNKKDGNRSPVAARRTASTGESRRPSLIREAEDAISSSGDAANPNEGSTVILEFTEGCFLGTPVLMTAAGESGYWEPVAKEGRLTGVLGPATYTAKKDCRISYITLKDFEGIVGSMHSKLSNSNGKGIRRQDSDNNLASNNLAYCKEDFQELAMLGTGSFGRVSLARYKKHEKPEDPKIVALKAVSKVGVVEGGQLAHLHDERKLLLKLQHPFIMRLYGTFQDRDHVFFVTEAIMGGELWSVIYEGLSGQTMYGLPVEHARFYASTVIEALSFMHYKGVAYRDLKPENIMVDDQGYTRIIDLGFAKKIPFIEDKDGRIEVYPKSYTMCGTPEYLAPEFIFNKGHDVSADYWAFGVLVFELIAGHTPFVPPEGYSNITELFTSIATSKRQGIPFPEDFNAKAKGRDARDLIIKLLQAEPSHRLGNLAGRADDIKDHPFFKKTIDFTELYEKKINAPWIPTTHFPQSQGADDKHDLLIYFGKQELFEGF